MKFNKKDGKRVSGDSDNGLYTDTNGALQVQIGSLFENKASAAQQTNGKT